MSAPNKFTKAEERRIIQVGQKIQEAREAKRLSKETAAEMTVTPSRRGRMTTATWTRVEKAYTTINVNGQQVRKIYRPSALTLAAIAEVVGLDGDELCREIGLRPPPARVKSALTAARERGRTSLTDGEVGNEIRQIKILVLEVLDRVEELERTAP